MKMFQNFKNPEEDSDSMDDLGDDENELELIIPQQDILEALNDVEISDVEDSEYDPNMESYSTDSPAGDFNMTNDSVDFSSGTSVRSSDNEHEDSKPSTSVARKSTEVDEEESDDGTVRAIKAAIDKPRRSPPQILLEDHITDICFHPERDIIALGTVTGDVSLYNYSNEDNTLLRTIEIHAKSVRDIEFTNDGRDLLTCSKDKSIMITDMETEKLKKFYESAHDDAINKLLVIDENLFATGDDGGTVKLWDLRTKEAIFDLKEVEDYISQLLTNDAKKLLLVTSGDGYLTTINIGARKLYVQSEPYGEEFTCMGLYRNESKLVVATSQGRFYSYNWGQFGYHCDTNPATKTPISVMTPITDRIACVAGEEGIIRACHIAPYRNLGIVGQHNMPIESMDVNNSGELIATSSHNNDVSFWNVKYFEEFVDIKYNAKQNTAKENRHNLPSSNYSNASDFFADLAQEPSGNE